MRYLSLIIILLSLSFSLVAKTLNKEDVPAPLKPWVNWVLFDEQKRDCPFIYNNYGNKKCAWPARLELNINKNKARFSQSWQVFESSWVTLPGDKKYWPQNVSINNRLALVTERNGLPVVYLKKGQYHIKGNFYWESIPESLQIPAQSALVNLFIKGRRITSPDINRQGHIWLVDNTKITQEVASDKMTLNVYRLLDDKIPMRIITRLDLQVSGSSREVNLGQVILAEQVPVSLISQLPALLNNKGELRLQVKPGRWTVDVTSRAKQNLTSLKMNAATNDLWPRTEVWVFQAQNHLRIVKLEGASRIDPRQTKLPAQWHSLPAFRLSKGMQLVLNETRRGDAQPQADQLNLTRNMWLDFDGKGYTIKDEIKGTVTKSWRLETSSELEPGRITIDNVPQFITQLAGKAGESNKGVEIRRGTLNLTADSRYEGNVREISATGWRHEFKSVSTTLHLPPGWRIFSASGVDNIPQTWLQKWTLLDLFLVLIISIAIAQLWSWQWGIVGLITMSLIWHESGMVPQFIWLNLLAVIAVLKVLPDGKARKMVSWYQNISVVILLLMVIPFMVSQVRTAIYPQLEKSGVRAMMEQNFSHAPAARKRAAKLKQEEAVAESMTGELKSKLYSSRVLGRTVSDSVSKSREYDLQAFDPKANVQTGPGLPQWQWNKVHLSWNSPVQAGQQVSLVLISPLAHSLLNILRVVFVALLCLLMLKSIPKIPIPWVPSVSKVLLLFVLIPVLFLNSNEAMAKSASMQDKNMPDKGILNELKKRLTQPPECLPKCAQIQSMIMRVSKTQLQIKLNVHAIQKVAIPLPARVKQWMPSKVIIDGRPATAMYRAKDGVLWIELPRGRFNLMLSGKLNNRKHIQLPLQLRPGIVQSKLTGWSIEGIQQNGVPDAQLQLSREQAVKRGSDSKFQDEQTEALPPFLIVERHLKLGLDWFVETTVRRVSPVGSAVVVKVPLLKGESILTEGLRSQNGLVLVNMSPRQRQIFWRSSLEKSNQLKLTASDNDFSTELWEVSVSPIWHLEYSGLAVIQNKNQRGRWSPKWHPWQGESVTLNITRPQGVSGNTLTIDKSHVLIKPGKRMVEAQLDLSLRSSRGGQYTLTLPEESDLQSVKINNAVQSIRLEGNNLTLPVTPGKQTVQLVWRHATAMQALFSSPVIDLKQDSVNHAIKVKFPRDRWVLFVGGPDLGPAILFWGVLIVILILAVAMGYTTFTPLNTVSWLLLAIGLSQVPIWMGFIVIAWLSVLGLREKLIQKASDILFNVVQVGIGALTFLALISLFVVIQQGLLGSPNMQVAGNGSSATIFNWYQDRNTAVLPDAWLLSVPILVYRLLMLAWALWLAFSLLRWLKWGWQQCSIGGLWKDISAPSPARAAPASRKITASETKALPAKDDDSNKDR
ncbi:FIG00606402: hypothetical protein [hydrothermal vent metagenome]|uniref:Uncharacterized protein n=1 Tax=hydrothermal vent metagenome TaxID=652676 RepID=A0A3B1A9C9_9ZZZZ